MPVPKPITSKTTMRGAESKCNSPPRARLESFSLSITLGGGEPQTYVRLKERKVAGMELRKGCWNQQGWPFGRNNVIHAKRLAQGQDVVTQ